MRRRFGPVLLLAVLALMLGAAPAWAHKIKVFATAEGTRIFGYAYFNGGTRAAGVRVAVVAPDGTPIFSGITDTDGTFRFEATGRVDHWISVAGDDGHAASFVIPAADLPERLPVSPGAAAVARSERAASPPPDRAGAAAAPIDADQLRAMIEQGVAQQIRPLREQIESYQDKIWWHDVLGGIGYIVGLGGLAYGLGSRRSKAAP